MLERNVMSGEATFYVNEQKFLIADCAPDIALAAFMGQRLNFNDLAIGVRDILLSTCTRLKLSLYSEESGRGRVCVGALCDAEGAQRGGEEARAALHDRRRTQRRLRRVPQGDPYPGTHYSQQRSCGS